MPFTGAYADFEHVLHARDGAPVPVRHLVPRARRRGHQHPHRDRAAAVVRAKAWPSTSRSGRSTPRRPCGCGTPSLEGKLPTIEQMTADPYEYFPYRFGHALWSYIGERWGDEAVGAILQGHAERRDRAGLPADHRPQPRAARPTNGATRCRSATSPKSARGPRRGRCPTSCSPRNARRARCTWHRRCRRTGRRWRTSARRISTSSTCTSPTARPARSSAASSSPASAATTRLTDSSTRRPTGRRTASISRSPPSAARATRSSSSTWPATSRSAGSRSS